MLRSMRDEDRDLDPDSAYIDFITERCYRRCGRAGVIRDSLLLYCARCYKDMLHARGAPDIPTHLPPAA